VVSPSGENESNGADIFRGKH
jgi:hypothetical protein